MELVYAVDYSHGGEHWHWPMDGNIERLHFKSKNELIQFINCMCIAMNGKSFRLSDKYPNKIAHYSKKLFSSDWKHTHSTLITNSGSVDYASRHRFRNWHGYLNDIRTMPNGITVSMRDEIMPDAKFRYKEPNAYRIQHALVTLEISESYSRMILKKKQTFHKHKEILKSLTDMTTFTAWSLAHTQRIYIGRQGVSWEHKNAFFSSFNMKPLETAFDCFTFANVWVEYFLDREKKDIDFSKVTLSLGPSVMLGNEQAYVSIDVTAQLKPYEKKLNNW